MGGSAFLKINYAISSNDITMLSPVLSVIFIELYLQSI